MKMQSLKTEGDVLELSVMIVRRRKIKEWRRTKQMRYFIGFLIKGGAKDFQCDLIREIFEKFAVEPLTNKLDPHITLKAPFEATDEQIHEVVQIIESFCSTVQPIDLKLRNFGHFDTNVIFVDVEENPWLQLVFKNLNERLGKANWMTFGKFDFTKKFHSTIVSGNFEEEKFSQIWDFISIKSVGIEMIFDGIAVFRKINGKWEVYKEFNFSHS